MTVDLSTIKAPKRILNKLAEIKTAAEARQLLEVADHNYAQVEGEIEDLQEELEDLEAECHALEQLIPLLEAIEDTPEHQERMARLAAVNNPNQQRFPFLERQGERA